MGRLALGAAELVGDRPSQRMLVLSTRDADPADRIPLMGYGTRPTLDQAAKTALLLANGGEHRGSRLLHRERTLEALGMTGPPGLHVDARTSYRHGMWRRSVRVGGCRTGVSYMQGHGGTTCCCSGAG